MSAIPGIGIAELVILSGATGLVCSLPVIGALILAAIVLGKKEARVFESGYKTE